MRGILYAKFIWLYRNPWTFIAMTAMTIVFALIMGGSNLDKETIPIYTELNEDDFIIHTMKENELFEMEFVSKTEMKDSIQRDRKSTRLNSSHVAISYAVFCLKKKN